MTVAERLQKEFATKTVLVIGDVMIDAYLFGGKKVDDHVPVPILEVSRKEKRLGGAANVALNIQALGATPILCSVVGDDHDGETFERLLEHQGMPNKGIIRSQNRRTTTKQRILAGSQQLLRIDSEDDHPLVDLDRKSLLNHIHDLSKECDLIIFEDYDKGTIHSEIISETIKLAKDQNIPVAVDPKEENFLAYREVSLFKPGLSELSKYVKDELDLKKESLLEKALNRLHEEVNAANYIVSLEGGDIFLRSVQKSQLYYTRHSGVSDMSGVGNAVISIAGLGLTLDMDTEVVAELANIGASIVAAYTGVVPVDNDQFFKEIEKSEILRKYL